MICFLKSSKTNKSRQYLLPAAYLVDKIIHFKRREHKSIRFKKAVTWVWGCGAAVRIEAGQWEVGEAVQTGSITDEVPTLRVRGRARVRTSLPPFTIYRCELPRIGQVTHK